jgi:ADP-L-glycero-D-manno-heptose 6-epimerase
MIVVTGAYGFIGSNLVRRLCEQSKTVVAVDFVQRPYLDGLPVTFVHATEFYNNLEQYTLDAEVIFHEGAISSTTETNVLALLEKNVLCSIKLIDFCQREKIPLSYASSASVYGNMSVEEWENPNKLLNPLNRYAESKKVVDEYASFMFDSKIPLQGFRYFNVYGPNETHKAGQSSPHFAFTQQLQLTGKIKLFENSDKFFRDFVSVGQVIDFKLSMLSKGISGIFDVGTATPISFYSVAVEVCKQNGITDFNSVFEYIPMPDNLKDHYQQYSKAVMY